MRRVVFLVVMNLLVGCGLPKGRGPSVVIVAVEGLGFDSLSCDAEDTNTSDYQGLKVLCDEAVRFSHAFTPSTMSQATMASLMTGLYPMQHGVHHNGPDFLAARFVSAPEWAIRRGYRTALFSGGPPLLRKSGLSQGFETFDDFVPISLNKLYRPAGEVFQGAREWIESRVRSSPFFLTMFLADLQFPETATYNSSGELRPLGVESQTDEVMESLTGFTHWLKRTKRWNQTHLVLVGANVLRTLGGDSDPTDLRSQSTQVALFIKPARRERDNIIQWAVDRNVSLVDVGRTILTWVGAPAWENRMPWSPVDLNRVLRHPEPNWSEDRLIIGETAWPQWRLGKGVRWSLRQNQFLYIHDEKPLIFNTLTDRLETTRLRKNDPLWTSLNQDILRMVKELNLPVYVPADESMLVHIQAARDVRLGERHPISKQGGDSWSYWFLREALQSGNWLEVKRYSEASQDQVGLYVAGVHLGERVSPPRSSCMRILQSRLRSVSHDCSDELILNLADWREAKSNAVKMQALERFFRSYSLFKLDQEIGWMNYVNGLRWDVSLKTPGPPHAVEYLLTVPPFESLVENLGL